MRKKERKKVEVELFSLSESFVRRRSSLRVKPKSWESALFLLLFRSPWRQKEPPSFESEAPVRSETPRTTKEAAARGRRPRNPPWPMLQRPCSANRRLRHRLLAWPRPPRRSVAPSRIVATRPEESLARKGAAAGPCEASGSCKAPLLSTLEWSLYLASRRLFLKIEKVKSPSRAATTKRGESEVSLKRVPHYANPDHLLPLSPSLSFVCVCTIFQIANAQSTLSLSLSLSFEMMIAKTQQEEKTCAKEKEEGGNTFYFPLSLAFQREKRKTNSLFLSL